MHTNLCFSFQQIDLNFLPDQQTTCCIPWQLWHDQLLDKAGKKENGLNDKSIFASKENTLCNVENGWVGLWLMVKRQ